MNLHLVCNLQIFFLRVEISHAWSQPKDNHIFIHLESYPVCEKEKKIKERHTQLKYSMCLVFTEAYSPENNHLKYVLQIEFLMGYM